MAFEATVPVASPALPELVRSTSSCGSEYLVLAVNYCLDHDPWTINEVARFSHVLIWGVIRLLHDISILHGDWKPDNVIWQSDNDRLALIDFGNAQPIRTAVPRRGYEASELLQGLPCSMATDTFSVGRILLELLQRNKKRQRGRSLEYGVLYKVGIKLTASNPAERLPHCMKHPRRFFD